MAPDRIVLFAKFPSCLIGHEDQIRYPAVTTQLDYEGELAVVIGRTARDVPVEQALDYAGGYTIINDVSARDLQGSEPQWIRGKALDTFAPLGPVVLDVAAAPAVADMRLRTLVNGDVRQDASCAQMITGVPELIAYISNGITLEPGDIISTGTPSGVAMGMNPPKYLQPGDKVSIEITAIGELANSARENVATINQLAQQVAELGHEPSSFEIGLDVEVTPSDLVALTSATVATIALAPSASATICIGVAEMPWPKAWVARSIADQDSGFRNSPGTSPGTSIPVT